MSTTETKVRHSTLPWSVGHDGPSRPIILTGGHGMLSVDKFDERGKWSSYDNEEADCEFIVRAVNSHADMLEALELLTCDPAFSGTPIETRRTINAAIQKANSHGDTISFIGTSG